MGDTTVAVAVDFGIQCILHMYNINVRTSLTRSAHPSRPEFVDPLAPAEESQPMVRHLTPHHHATRVESAAPKSAKPRRFLSFYLILICSRITPRSLTTNPPLGLPGVSMRAVQNGDWGFHVPR